MDVVVATQSAISWGVVSSWGKGNPKVARLKIEGQGQRPSPRQRPAVGLAEALGIVGVVQCDGRAA